MDLHLPGRLLAEHGEEEEELVEAEGAGAGGGEHAADALAEGILLEREGKEGTKQL